MKLELDHKSLNHYDIKPGATIHMQDDGYQVPLILGKLAVYSGPPFIFYMYSVNNMEIMNRLMGKEYMKHNFENVSLYEEGSPQIIGKMMIYGHFAKCLI